MSIHSLIKEHSIQTSTASVSVLAEEAESDEDSEDETDVTAYDKEVSGWSFLIY